MRRGFFSRFLICLAVFAVAFGATFGGLQLHDRRAAASSPVETASQPIITEAPATPTPTAEPTPEPTAEPTATPEPTPTPIAPPYHEEQAPDDYFENAVFIGNSLIEGLGLYSYIYDENIAKAKFDTATSLTIFGAGDYFRDAAEGGYDKIYIGLGLNEIGYDRETLREKNEEAVDIIREGNPDAIIYFFSLTPISRHRSESDSLYNMENANEVSQILREVAEEKGCYFMDMNPVLAGDDGYLPADVTGDGIHCVKEYYPKWYDYLEHNYVLP